MAGTLKKILDLVFLLRLPLLAPVWTILILGWIAGNAQATPGFSFVHSTCSSPLWFALIGFSLLVASIYVVNQITDIESDRINNKLFLLPDGFISVKTAWVVALFCIFSGLMVGFFLGNAIFMLFIIALILGFLYNLPPVSLKNRAIGGVLANALGHGIITFLVGWFITKSDAVFSTDLLYTGLISSLAPGFANGAVFLATTIPDAPGDLKTGKKTFCVSYGEKKTALAATMMCTLALIFSFSMEYNSWVMAIPSAISLFFFIRFFIFTDSVSAFNSFKWPVFLLSACVTIFVPFYGILIAFTFLLSRFYYKWRFGIEYPTFKAK
ncbi:UbiA family prenyltransferase [Chitinispirillales bacterium ANBcel5]|uniref:UbiA family prenyltransferase n=1 Tax=Cellulosispirillum alkaliphilum TaxID=3039283 RepID=UPI002A54FDC2|nr:UbiA family prenyltransferase [Chitinispirillales bacterium ANBcel5]